MANLLQKPLALRYSVNEKDGFERALLNQFQQSKEICKNKENTHEFRFAYSYITRKILDECRIEEVLNVDRTTFYNGYHENGLLLESQREHKKRFDRVALSVLRREGVFKAPWEDVFINTFTIQYIDRNGKERCMNVLRKCNIILTRENSGNEIDVLGHIETWSLNGQVDPFVTYDFIMTDSECRIRALKLFHERNKKLLFGSRTIHPGSELLLHLLDQGFSYNDCDSNPRFARHQIKAKYLCSKLLKRLKQHAKLESIEPFEKRGGMSRGAVHFGKVLGIFPNH